LIERREGLTNKAHLADTILKHTSVNVRREDILFLIDVHLERCIEVYKDDVLSGYVLIMDMYGNKSLHGYKLVDGYAFCAFKIAKDILKDYKNISVTTTKDQVGAIRIAELLGFRQTSYLNDVVMMQREYEISFCN
jgi:hypothetical protein